ncbi:response regulator transcription factor [Methylocystis bryophila]|uniref:DNA-binding response regulator n=1 Tax=Methylocystis bryophila TaxID=655015 RepID=A0A1W6MZE1_9HYPH|nr:response regulator transcription factor [Methylocystis bryophila]ARN82960.1 DNA-binding response regulator [Methylocystis bryophila]BDV39248.1 DNA-binding response regulator [Methylocystis bryophila]
MRILLVEDDERIASDVSKALKEAGYVVERAATGEDASFLGETEMFAAVILDLGLPKLDGLAVLKRWRAQSLHFPVLILTARGSWTEKVEGIDAGADDYLAKPFQIEELLARLRAILRRAAGRGSSIITAGRVMLDERDMTIKTGDGPIELSALEYRLLAYLMHRHGEVVAQSELVEHVYGSDHQSSNAIEVLVARVRKKIGSDVIETRRGLGYIVPNTTQ